MGARSDVTTGLWIFSGHRYGVTRKSPTSRKVGEKWGTRLWRGTSVRSSLTGVRRLGWGGGRFVVFEDAGDFAEESFLLLGVLILALRILSVSGLHGRRQCLFAAAEE